MFDTIKIKNRDEFTQYCLRQLGHPVIQINVTDDQIQDRINDALKMFFDYHVDGAEKAYIVHEINADDIKNKYITVPDDVLVVTGILNGSQGTNTNSYNLTNNLQMKAFFSDMMNTFSMYGMSNYVLTKSYIDTFNDILGSKFNLSVHNFYKRKLTGFFNWEFMFEGDVIAYEAWVANNIDEIFNSYWLQQYATALIRKQWGNNLIKVDGMTLPGGGRINGSAIIDQANNEIDKLEERMRDEFAYPIQPFMG